MLQPKFQRYRSEIKRVLGKLRKNLFVLHFLFYIRRIFRSVFTQQNNEMLYYKKFEIWFRNDMLFTQQNSKIYKWVLI